MRDLIRRALASAGLRLLLSRNYFDEDGLITSHKPRFSADPKFTAAYERGVRASHGHDPHIRWRVHTALTIASVAVALPGDFVECGVNAGFISSAIMHALNWSAVTKQFFLVDTFDGPVLTQFSPDELRSGRRAIAERALAAGAYVTDLERIKANFAEWPNAVVVQGAVPEILAQIAVDEVAFLHIDMNCATPEIAALEYFWPRIAAGGFVLLDDYGYSGHESQGEAVDAFAGSVGVPVLGLPTGQGLMVKGGCRSNRPKGED